MLTHVSFRTHNADSFQLSILQLLHQEPGGFLHHVRRVLLSGVSSERGDVHRGDDADLRTQRQEEQPHTERGGKQTHNNNNNKRSNSTLREEVHTDINTQ